MTATPPTPPGSPATDHRAEPRPAPGPEALAELIACPRCDALFQAPSPASGEKASCSRCHHVLIAPRQRAGKQVIAVALSVLILIIAATIFPYLSISAGGLENSSSILDAALAFSDDPLLAPLSLALVALIVLVPALRAGLAIYVLAPLIADRPALPGATRAFRLSSALQPWSMAEIFSIGCAVALIKIGSLAQVTLGPAFWMFSALIVLVVAQDRLLCSYSVWKALRS